MRLNETLAGDGTRDIVHVLYEPDSFTPLIRLSTTAQGAPKVKPHYMVQAIQAGTPQAGRNDPGTLDALAMMQDSLAGMPEDMRKMMERGVKRVVEQGLSPQMQAIMGEMGQNTNKLFGQIRQGLKEAEQQARTPVTVHFYHCDHLGTPIGLTDREGNIAWAARRDPFGNLIEEYNPNNIEQNIGMPGQYLDRETGLYYNYHRYYDPKISAYLNQDPIGLRGGVNLYGYALQNPISMIDPDGFQVAMTPVGPLPVQTMDPKQAQDLADQITQALHNSSSSATTATGKLKDSAGLNVSKTAENLKPPGMCSQHDYDRMKKEVDDACKSKPIACKASLGPIENNIRRDDNVRCATARDEMNRRCFLGGDLTHRNEAITAWRRVAKCDEMLMP